MIRFHAFCLFLMIPVLLCGQSNQVILDRISEMPDLPAPYKMADWKKKARDYDAFVFDFAKSGSYLPLCALGTRGQFNYDTLTPLFLDSYVGSAYHLQQGEAINIMPAVVGASLMGIDKSNQMGHNWVATVADFFNMKNGQNVYLNNYSTISGSDWWYDVMPNVYFYQLYSLYPSGFPGFSYQFASVANQWLSCVRTLGGSSTPWSIPSMNYRAFNLATGVPLSTGVIEPEAAGGIAWLLYQAYGVTGNRKYMEGAQQALDFLLGLTSNPSYELQLAYGTAITAKMNAIEGTTYDMGKLLNWCFDRGPLRGWGSIVGTWGGYDASGLIGEANDAGNDYAFVMNGFQEAGALSTVPKYDKRYALSIAKWLLNLANASRLFYWNELPSDQQSNYSWVSQYDPQACIPYESLKQSINGKSPYAQGDAVQGGWASTNLSLYSGSSVGYLASIIDTTNIQGILRINLNATDFYGDNTYPAYLYYNPTSQQQTIRLPLSDHHAVYDAISETTLGTDISGDFLFSIGSGSVCLLRILPATPDFVTQGNKLMLGSHIIDYHHGWDYTSSLRIKALSAQTNPVVVQQPLKIYCEPGNIASGDEPSFSWYINGTQVDGQTGKILETTAPADTGLYIVKCSIALNDQTAEDTLLIHVVNHIVKAPSVTGITTDSAYGVIGAASCFKAIIDPNPGDTLTYSWAFSDGNAGNTNRDSLVWTAPGTPGIYTLNVTVTNQDHLSGTATLDVLVKDTLLEARLPLIYYPFNGDAHNAVADQFHATVSGPLLTEDPRGLAGMAYRFSKGQDIIYTSNDAALNFQNAISVSLWVKCEAFDMERYILSHGSYEQRYKLSVIPEGKVRWTVKTSSGVVDLDSPFALDLNKYYHITALYTGYSMELYINGQLASFKKHSGLIGTSTKPITIGRKDNNETNWFLLGSVDEVKIWDSEIPVPLIRKLPALWNGAIFSPETPVDDSDFRLFYNPSLPAYVFVYPAGYSVQGMDVFNILGRKITCSWGESGQHTALLTVAPSQKGIMLVRVRFGNGKVVVRKALFE